MADPVELPLQRQIDKLRNTMFLSIVIGAIVFYVFVTHEHYVWALLDAIITAQVVCGSAIIRADIKQDLRALRELAKDRH